MPGMAEPGIAIDIVSSASGLTEAHGNRAQVFAPRSCLALRVLTLAGMDAAVTALSAVLCYTLFDPLRQITSSSTVISMALLTVCLSLSFLERGLYTMPEVVSRELPRRKLAVAWLQAVATGTLLTVCAGAIVGHQRLSLGDWVPAFLFLGFAALIGARMLRLRFFLVGPASLNRTVIIGEQGQIHDLLLRIRTGARRTFDVIGVVEYASSAEAPLTGDSFLGLPRLGGIDTLEQMIRQDSVDTVVVAMPWSASEQMRAIIQRLSMAPVDVYVYPGMSGLNLLPRHADKALDLPLLMACTRPLGEWQGLIKRAEDIALSVGLLAFISPVMLTIALVIKLTSRGPVFFRQRRLGYNSRVIEILKFRSMYTHLADADASEQALRGDKRVTPVGAWLRRTSLDELPQLLNVLRGEMSLVGPRPHALSTTAGGLALEEAVPVYPSRHRVKPGITGWAQVNGYRGALDSVDKIVHRVNHDLYYIENWSLCLDLKILWRTAALVFADDNAF
jgi:Undecaprenyl-phosphate glucose phosphotransferase